MPAPECEARRDERHFPVSMSDPHNEMHHPSADVATARWRVQVLVTRLHAHRALEKPHSQHWHEKEADYVRRLAAAQVELDQIERIVAA